MDTVLHLETNNANLDSMEQSLLETIEDDLIGVSTDGPDFTKMKETLENIQKNLFEIQFNLNEEGQTNPHKFNVLANETEILIESLLKELDDDSVDTIRLYAIKSHIAVLRANHWIDQKEYDEARQVLNEAVKLLDPYQQNADGIYSYIELHLAKGRSYYTEGLFTLALNSFRKAESTYNNYNGPTKNMIELFGLEKYVDITDKKTQEKWSIGSLHRLITVSIFTCYAIKNSDSTNLLKYALPALQAKVELAYINGEKCTALEVANKILDLVDIFIVNHHFRQADHLLSVAAYNLEKERVAAGKNEDKLRLVEQLDCLICHKYAWLGYLLLKGSLMYQEIKEKEAYGVPVTCDELRKLEIQMSFVCLTKLVGKGFTQFENQMSHVYVTDPDEAQEVVDTTKSWIRKGHRLAESQAERSKLICIMEDVLDIERKMKKTMTATTRKGTEGSHRVVRYK